jgi:hypothetical protein
LLHHRIALGFFNNLIQSIQQNHRPTVCQPILKKAFWQRFHGHSFLGKLAGIVEEIDI